jgi:hypothetical protein
MIFWYENIYYQDMTFVVVKPHFFRLQHSRARVGRHFEDESNKRNPTLLQESLPMVTTFGKLWYLRFTNGNKHSECIASNTKSPTGYII